MRPYPLRRACVDGLCGAEDCDRCHPGAAVNAAIAWEQETAREELDARYEANRQKCLSDPAWVREALMMQGGPVAETLADIGMAVVYAGPMLVAARREALVNALRDHADDCCASR